MLDTHFIVREPLLNHQERVLGYELSWQGTADAGREPSEDEALHLVRFAAEHLAKPDAESLLGEQVVFLEVTPRVLAGDALNLLPAHGTVLALRGKNIANDAAIAAVAAARAKGYAIALRDAAPDAIDQRVLKDLSYLELQISAPDFASQVQQHRAR
jgi:c-di-GMP-related signal transduction protein